MIFPTDRLNFTNNLHHNAMLVLREYSRPTMIPMTVAYDDGGDAPPNVATLRDDQEGDLRVDSFGGRYPSRAYMQQNNALNKYVKGFFDIGGQLTKHMWDAKKKAMETTTYRGKPLSKMSLGSQTVRNFEKEFAQNYKDPEELLAMRRGREELIKITRNILKADPKHQAFMDAEELRGDVIMGRRNPDGSWRQSYLRDRYTGD